MKELLLFAAFVAPTPDDFNAFDPVVVPKPAPKMEYRLIDGRLYYVPSDSPWTTPSIPAVPNCPDGRCPLPNR